MRMSILNTAATEQMGQGSFSFFVYTESTDPYRLYRSEGLCGDVFDWTFKLCDGGIA